MVSILGIPVVGSLFLPVFVGAVTLFLFWNYVISKKHAQLTENKFQDCNYANLQEDSKNKELSKSRKTKGCCGGGKNKPGSSCSSKTAPIESLKIILSCSSSLCLELSEILSQSSIKANITCDCTVASNRDFKILLENEASGTSLCTFLFDASENSDLYLWLKETVCNRTNKSKPLSGMKYAVFCVGNNKENDSPAIVRPDQWLHKLGAVRVSKGGTANITSTAILDNFQQWTEELFNQVLKWNEPKNKVCNCNCGQKDERDGCEKGSCSEGSSCSDSDGDVEKIDLEDIGRVLNRKSVR